MKIINEGQGPLKEYMGGVEFSAMVSSSEWCCCDGCFRTARVTKITLPTTKYFHGRKLSTRYFEAWYCADCLKKLKDALEHTTEEQE